VGIVEIPSHLFSVADDADGGHGSIPNMFTD